MPVWGWVLLIASLSVLVIAAVGLIVHRTHRLRSHEPLHGDAENVAAPLPLDVAAGGEQTARELDAARPRDPTAR